MGKLLVTYNSKTRNTEEMTKVITARTTSVISLG